jgi:MiaB/RimO family radical SAM methylthiotransferase
MKYFHVVNKSCYRRKEEINKVEMFFLKNGWIGTSRIKKADIVLFFTCAFCQSKVMEMLNTLHCINKSKKLTAEIIVGSCLPKTDKASLDLVFKGKIIYPTDFTALDDLDGVKFKFDEFKVTSDAAIIPKDNVSLFKIIEYYKKNGLLSTAGKAIDKLLYMSKLRSFNKKRKGIIVSSGCRRNCSYCAIRFATGSLRSKPLNEIIEKIQNGLLQGYKKFELYADCIGDYGLDIGTNLSELLEKILEMKQTFSVGIYDLHPISFNKYYNIIESLCKSGKVHYLYVPLQSGNERILKLMNRHCALDDLKKNLLQLKEHKIFLQTSIIVGFPTETEEEFNDTVKFIKTIKFDNVYVHFYSDMPNTQSSKLSGKISTDIMKTRFETIMKEKVAHDLNETRQEYENSIQ